MRSNQTNQKSVYFELMAMSAVLLRVMAIKAKWDKVENAIGLQIRRVIIVAKKVQFLPEQLNECELLFFVETTGQAAVSQSIGKSYFQTVWRNWGLFECITQNYTDFTTTQCHLIIGLNFIHANMLNLSHTCSRMHLKQ